MGQTVAGIRAGIYPDEIIQVEATARAFGIQIEARNDVKPDAREQVRSYEVFEGVALIPVSGVLMKGASKFVAGTSTVDIRRQLREAAKDDQVEAVLLLIDSPGGHVAGTMELADEVARTNAIKPVTAQINDLGASAAYWVASQASRIAANKPAEIGSIGVVAVVHDTSGYYEKEGVKVHVVSTGPLKGAFTDGTPVSKEMLDNLQAKVDGLNAMFKGSIQQARPGMDVESVATGETFLADKALQLGLIDIVSDSEKTLDMIVSEVKMKNRRRQAFAKLDQLAPSREK